MSDAVTLLERAKSAVIAHDYNLAARIYKNLIMEEPDNQSYKNKLGNLYIKAGKDEQALTVFQQIQKTDPKNFDALIAIAGIYRRQKKYAESVSLLEQALVTFENKPKSHAKIYYNLGFTYRQMGSYDDAIRCFEEVVEEVPSDVLANNHLGAIYALQGKYNDAIKAYNRGLKYDPNHPILQFNIAKSYSEIGDIHKALNFYEGALRARPGWTDAIESYADLLLFENKVNEADEVVSQGLKINPDDAKVHTAKGNVYNRRSIFEDAELEFKKALSADESYRNALVGLAHSLEKQDKKLEAIETIDKAGKLYPDDVNIMKQSAHIHLTANKLPLALEKINKLREIDSNDVETLNLLGQYYIANKDGEKAQECFTEIKKINPDYNEVYRDWGERFIQCGEEAKAEQYLQAAIQKNPTDSDAMVHLGELYEKQNQIGKALQYYKKASTADIYNHKSKAASARLLGDDDDIPSLSAADNLPHSVDYDSIFSGGKIDAPEENKETSENAEGEDENPKIVEAESISPEKASEFIENAISDSGEISLAEEEVELGEDEVIEISDGTASSDEIPSDVSDEEFDFDQFGMEKLAAADPGANDVVSVADYLKNDEAGSQDDSVLDFDDLIDDGAPIDEEDDDDNPAYPIEPYASDYAGTLSDSNESPVPAPSSDYSPRSEGGSQKPEIFDDRLNELSEQIKKASQLAADALNAASMANASAARNMEKSPVVENVSDEIPLGNEKFAEKVPRREELEPYIPPRTQPQLQRPEPVKREEAETPFTAEDPTDSSDMPFDFGEETSEIESEPEVFDVPSEEAGIIEESADDFGDSQEASEESVESLEADEETQIPDESDVESSSESDAESEEVPDEADEGSDFEIIEEDEALEPESEIAAEELLDDSLSLEDEGDKSESEGDESEDDEVTDDEFTDDESEDFFEGIPDYLQDEEENLAENEDSEENKNSLENELSASEDEKLLEDELIDEQEEDDMVETEKETPKVDDLTLRRAIDMLPSIIAAIEDRSVIYKFRSFLAMFKALREMLEYLPAAQKREFMTSRNRLLLDYVISKLSGRPGLFATAKALIRSGLIHENPYIKPSEKDGLELVKDVIPILRGLIENLEDETLRIVLNNEADNLEKLLG